MQHPRVDGPRGDGVLDVVDRVGDVVGPVHDVGLEASHARLDALPEPLVDRQVRRVHPELLGVPDRLATRPGVLGGGVEAGAGEVQTGGAAVRVRPLGLEPGEDAQRLGVPLEPADVGRDGVERLLAVVAERRVAEVVRETGGVHDVRVAAERGAELAADLRHLERVGQAGPGEVVTARAATTWVLAESRRSAAEWISRARSRAKSSRSARWYAGSSATQRSRSRAP